MLAADPSQFVRSAGGRVWIDKTLADWPTDGFRLFIGNLAPTVTSEQLTAAFQAFPSFLKAHVPSRGKGNAGYGFVALGAFEEMQEALRTWNGREMCGRRLQIARSSVAGHSLKQGRAAAKARELKQLRKRMQLSKS
jgi:RNA recognition motif-containing protein